MKTRLQKDIININIIKIRSMIQQAMLYLVLIDKKVLIILINTNIFINNLIIINI